MANTELSEAEKLEVFKKKIWKEIDSWPRCSSISESIQITDEKFKMDCELQGNGIGSKIVSESLEYLSEQGFHKCQLGIDKDNPQSNHFWRKNGFEVIREVEIEEGVILVAEKQL